jgi:Protein of unknown function (DUF4240)
MGFFNKLFGKKRKPDKQNQPLLKIENSENLMADNKFWEIIESSKVKSLGNYEKQQVKLGEELNKLEAKEILEFDNKFRTLRGQAYTWDLWAAAYIINGGCSDDCFSDFRGWLIGQGKTTFENGLKNSEALVIIEHDPNNGDWEGLSYVPMEIFEKKTGSNLPNGIKENHEISGEEWSEEGDDLEKKFPKLWEKWGLNE